MQIYFFLLNVHVHMILENNASELIRTLNCKHKIWGENWSYLRPYLKAFRVFNVLETCRVYLLTIGLESFSFIKKIIERFLKNAKFVGVDQITCKNCNKST